MTARTAKKTKKKTAKRSAKTVGKKPKKAAAKQVTAKKVGAPKAAKKKTVTKKKVAKAKAAKPSGRTVAAKKKKTTNTASAAPAKKRSGAAERKRLERFKGLLLEKQQNLARVYNSTKNDSRNVTSDGTEDYIDYAVSSYDRDFMLSLSELERNQLVKIEGALRRIDRGEFGRCLNCGQEIPDKRLEVEPWAQFCVRCQELEEQGLLDDRRLDFGFGSDDDDEAETGDDAGADTDDDEVDDDLEDDDVDDEE